MYYFYQEARNMLNELLIKDKIELDKNHHILYILEKKLSDEIIIIDNKLFNN